MKLDTLSRLSAPETCMVATAHWEIEDILRQAQHTQPDAVNGPQNRLLVPDPVCAPGGHSFKLYCHCGINRTIPFIKQRFWWPISSDTATETEDLQVLHMFHLHGIPQNIVLVVCSSHPKSGKLSYMLLEPLPACPSAPDKWTN